MLKTAAGFIHSKLVSDRRAYVLAELIGGLLPANAKVLDVGTGNGQIAKLWCQARSDVAVEGIDVFVRKATHIQVREFDGRLIPCADKSVDVVTFVDVLHHSTDPQRLLIEAARVARQSIIVKDHLAKSRFDHAVLRLMDWVGNAPHGAALAYDYLSKARWLQLFDEARLNINSFTTDVSLYPPPLSFAFGRQLHFVADLQPDLAGAGRAASQQ